MDERFVQKVAESRAVLSLARPQFEGAEQLAEHGRRQHDGFGLGNQIPDACVARAEPRVRRRVEHQPRNPLGATATGRHQSPAVCAVVLAAAASPLQGNVLAAVTDANPEDWQSAEFLQQLVASSARVTLTVGKPVVQNLRIGRQLMPVAR